MEVQDILAKKILTESKGFLDTGYTHTLNPYSGCAFACKYCYVREMPIQKFKEIPWGEWLEIKTNASENYRNEITKLRKKNKIVNIFMSSATDPYQPIERKVKITRSLLEEMIENPPDFILVQTRSPLVTRDIDLFLKLKDKCGIRISMTIETDSEEIKQLFAPYAPGIKLRLKALKEIHDAGILTQAAVSPLLPSSNDFPKIFEGIVDRICIDTLTIGDGSLGKRSERLGMPQLFMENGYSKWYQKDLHVLAIQHFEKYYPKDMIKLSQEGFAP